MNYRTENLSLLHQIQPQLAAAVSAVPPTPFPAEDARNGSPTLRVRTRVNELLLHSRYDPESEARHFLEAFNLQSGEIPLLLGFGLGYLCRELQQHAVRFPRIYVLEARPDIFSRALELRDLRDIFSDQRIRFFVDRDHRVLMQTLHTLSTETDVHRRLRLIVHQPSLSIYKDDASELTDIVERSHLSPRLQQLLRQNFHANLEYTIRSPGINTLFGRAEKKPVFLISAGPSLRQDLPLLQTVSGRALLICVSTCFRLLRDNGIRPDYVAIGDPKAIMLSHFDGCLDSDVPLLFLPTASKEVIAAYQGPKIVALQKEYRLSDFVEQRVPKGRVEVGESVSTFILDVAIRMGADPVVFVGQDLAFSDGYSHACGIEKRLRVSTAPRIVKNVRGQDIPTSSVYYWFLHWIEKRISREPHRTFLNASQTGAHIAGTTPRALAEIIRTYCG